jgi:ketosteroid isomerase-like protein
MKITTLTGPVANYIAAANSHDVEAVTAIFADDAVVRDEGQNRQGIAAIRQWAEEVSRKYRPTVEALDVTQTDGKTILSGRVSGDFPGSPIELRYAFTLNGGKIERLEIA